MPSAERVSGIKFGRISEAQNTTVRPIDQARAGEIQLELGLPITPSETISNNNHFKVPPTRRTPLVGVSIPGRTR